MNYPSVFFSTEKISILSRPERVILNVLSLSHDKCDATQWLAHSSHCDHILSLSERRNSSQPSLLYVRRSKTRRGRRVDLADGAIGLAPRPRRHSAARWGLERYRGSKWSPRKKAEFRLQESGSAHYSRFGSHASARASMFLCIFLSFHCRSICRGRPPAVASSTAPPRMGLILDEETSLQSAPVYVLTIVVFLFKALLILERLTALPG